LRSAGRAQQDSGHDESENRTAYEHSATPRVSGARYASGERPASAMIGELEEAFMRACPSFLPQLKTLREDHKLFGADLQTELTEILDKLGFHLGSTAKQIPTS
jgi:hypothetical protein